MKLYRKGLGKHFKNGLSIIKVKHVYYTKLEEKLKKATDNKGRRNCPQCHYFDYSNKSQLTSYYMKFGTLHFSFTMIGTFSPCIENTS